MDKNATVGDYMTSLVHTVGTEQTISFALDHMREHQIRHLPVLRGGRLVGLVSDRDLGLVAGLNDVNPDNTKVEEAMTAVPYTTTPGTPLLDVLQQMTEHKYGSVIVMEGSKVAGIFTTYDALILLTRVVQG
ncbi:MAG: CBS domain-containing protein [Polyangiaceae bacterium]